LLKDKVYTSVLIFSSRKDKVKSLRGELRRLNLNADAIHSDLKQDERESTLRSFSSRKLNVLIATDILSRGIDIDGIDLVINYDVPRDAEDYIHRIGRTARASSFGKAITFINAMDQGSFKKIEDMIEKSVEKLPLPPGMPEGPKWDPAANKGFRRPGSHHGGGGKHKGKRSFPPRKK